MAMPAWSANGVPASITTPAGEVRGSANIRRDDRPPSCRSRCWPLPLSPHFSSASRAAATIPARAPQSRSPTAGCRNFRSPRNAARSRCPENRDQARRPQDHAFGRRPAGQYAQPARRSAVHSRRRPRPGSELPRTVRRGADRRAQGSRHRARRPARHRPLVAARVRGFQAGPQPRGGDRVRSGAESAQPARGSSLRRASTPRNTRRPRGSPTSMPCAPRWATTRSTSGAARTERAQRRNTCAGTRTTCAASCSTASLRRR